MPKTVSNNTYDEKNNKIICELQSLYKQLGSCQSLIKKQASKKQIDKLETELLELNNGLILKVCRKYNKITEFEDAVQYGKLELLKAAKSYDLKSEFKFSTYASIFIKNNAMHREINLNKVNRFYKKLQEVLMEYENEGNQNPTYREIADKMKMDYGEFVSMYKNIKPLSIDATSFYKNTDEPVSAIVEMVKDETEDVEQKAIDLEEREIIYEAILKCLTEREAHCIDVIYFKGKTQIELANELNITRGRVNQIIKNALRKMKPYLTRRMGLNFKGERFEINY